MLYYDAGKRIIPHFQEPDHVACRQNKNCHTCMSQTGQGK